MKIKILAISCVFASNLIFTNCTENPKNNDVTSTITPGNELEVDSATAHKNNTDSVTQVKNNRMDSSHVNNH